MAQPTKVNYHERIAELVGIEPATAEEVRRSEANAHLVYRMKNGGEVKRLPVIRAGKYAVISRNGITGLKDDAVKREEKWASKADGLPRSEAELWAQRVFSDSETHESIMQKKAELEAYHLPRLKREKKEREMLAKQ